MDIESILNALERYDGTFPREALQQAIEQRESITPHLLEALRYTRDHAKELPDEYCLHTWAMFLLAQFRETRAYPLVVDLLDLPYVLLEKLHGDVMIDDAGRILASVCGGDLSLIHQLVERPEVEGYVRSGAMAAQVCLVAVGQQSREETLEYFRGLFHTAQAGTDDLFWAALARYSMELHPDLVLPEIRSLFERQLIDPFFLSVEEVEEVLNQGKERTLEELAKNQHYQLINDTIAETEWWSWFQPTVPTSEIVAPLPVSPPGSSPAMEIEAVVKVLTHYDGTFPREALLQAIAQREKITPYLLDGLRYAREHAEGLPSEYYLHTWAMYLLAQFRETRAYPLVVDLLDLPGTLPEELHGDLITEDASRILASVYDGDPGPIERLAEKLELDEYVRSAALEALVVLVATGQRSREETLEYFRLQFHTAQADPESIFWSSLVSHSVELYPDLVLPEIQAAFDKQLIDPLFIEMEDVQAELTLGKEQVLEKLVKDPHHRLVEDTIRETEWWAAFRSEEREWGSAAATPEALPDPWFSPAFTAPPLLPKPQPVQVVVKPGRNDPCFCGSGLKYKKCCLKKGLP